MYRHLAAVCSGVGRIGVSFKDRFGLAPLRVLIDDAVLCPHPVPDQNHEVGE